MYAIRSYYGMAHAEPRPGTRGPALSRRATAAASDGPAPASVADVLSSSGTPLPDSARAFFEPRFGHDFGRVRIHDDAQAAASAREVAAQAYTVGRHVVFGSGHYAPDSAKSYNFV